MQTAVEPADRADVGPPLAVVVVPAVTMVAGPLLVAFGWDFGAVLAGSLGAATAGWCLYRKVLSVMPLLVWNLAIMIWAGYDLL